MTKLSTDLRSIPDPLLAVWPHLQPGELTPELQAEANDAVRGTLLFRFQGAHPIVVGTRDIDWSGGQKAHQEWPAQLNRFRFLEPLAAAWRQTRDEQYALAARGYLEDWMRTHPVRTDWTLSQGDSRLNLAIRVGNSAFFGWGGAIFAFAGSTHFDEEFQHTLLQSLQAQLNFLVNDLTTAGNWRIAQGDCLLTTGVRFPQCEGAAGWRKRGVEVINEAARAQFLPDGVHIERTPSYHSWMTRVLHAYWALSRAHPELGLQIKTDLVQCAYEYWLASTRPNGETNRLHDSQSTLPHWSAVEPYQAFRKAAGLSGGPLFQQYFPHAGQALMRHGEGAKADYATFDATPYSGGHGHLSINALQLDVKGKPILVDPGMLDYERTNPMMAYGKSTRAHNTVNFNGWNQAPITHAKTAYAAAPGYNFVSGKYEGGYWPAEYDWNYRSGLQGGLWARHHRLVLWVHDRFLLVLDHLMYHSNTDALPSIECNWQFERGQITVDAERDEVVTRNPDANLLLRVLGKPLDAKIHCYEGETDPIRGWTASEECLGPAPLISVRSEGVTAQALKFVTLLVPFEGCSTPVVSAEIVAGSEERVFKIGLFDETIFVFLDSAPFSFSRDGIHFFGSAGVLRSDAVRSSLWLAAPGSLAADGQAIEREWPAVGFGAV